MNFIVSANTDIGIVKETNQDSLSTMVLTTSQGPMVFALLCDGMGGLSKGELASATLVRAFRNWVLQKLPELSRMPLDGSQIREQWEKIIKEQNQRIKAYGASQGIRIGTTAVAMLLTQNSYYILNVGDSRAYELTDTLKQITEDQTFVDREVKLGRMTPEQAATDSRRSVLLQCVGASEQVYPDFFTGPVACNAVYLLCSDGFRHEITPQEIYQKLQPGLMLDEQTMRRSGAELIELNKQRQERDNISLLLVRTY